MKKVKFNFKKLENEKIEIDGQEVEIKPYISTEDAIAITKLCLGQFENGGIETFPAIKLVYDMAVAELCTNISFEGIKSKKSKGVITLTLDLDADKIAKFEGCSLSTNFCKIERYEQVYNDIIKAIELKNIYMAINGLAKSIPTPDSMNDIMTNLVREVKRLKDKNPELLEVAIKDREQKEYEKIIKE